MMNFLILSEYTRPLLFRGSNIAPCITHRDTMTHRIIIIMTHRIMIMYLCLTYNPPSLVPSSHTDIHM